MREFSRIVLEIVGATGLAGAVMFGLSSWLGKVWAQRILEKEKTELELLKFSLARYSESQFHSYNKLWASLTELKFSGDILWVNVDINNLVDFVKKLQEVEKEAMRNALLIEDEHYRQLNILLDKFKNYEGGKYKIMELDAMELDAQEQGRVLGRLNQKETRQQYVNDNASTKREYEKLLSDILKNFKEQLKRYDIIK